jgi:hypothetical protein
MAGFQLTLHGRIWVTPEVKKTLEKDAILHEIAQPRRVHYIEV